MSDNIIIKSRAVPANPRSKNYPAGTIISSSSGGGSSTIIGGGGGLPKLSKDIRANSPQTGHIIPGDVLSAGMSLEQVFRKMLYKPIPATLSSRLSTANDVEFGSSKGIIAYTAVRNDNGPMTKSYYDDNEDNALIFSIGLNGVQIATRQLTGIYTQGESYSASVVYSAGESGDLPETKITDKISVNVRRKWFAGVCNSIPGNSSQVRTLLSNGLYNGSGTYKFSAGQWRTVAVCIPADSVVDISIASSYGNFVENGKVCTGPIQISVEGANGSASIPYKMWVIQTQGTNDSDTFTFKTA